MKYDVFISYSREDYLKNNQPDENSVVAKVLKTFDEAGITYWIDKECIYSGNEFAEEISNAIEDSRVFLFISTVNSNASKWTAREIASAEDIQHPIIPFRVDRTPYNRQIRLFVANLDYIDYQKNGDKAFDALLTAVNKHLERIKIKERKDQDEVLERKRKAILQTRYAVKLDMIQEQIITQQKKRNELIQEMEKEGLEAPIEEIIQMGTPSNGDSSSILQPNESVALFNPLKSKKGRIFYSILVLLFCSTITLGIMYFEKSDESDFYYPYYLKHAEIQENLKCLSNTYPMIISKIEIANTNFKGTIKSDYGEKIYEKESMFLRPRITYYGLSEGKDTLNVRWYRPDGTLSTGEGSPKGFSQEDQIVSIKKGENTLTLDYWGNRKKGNWKSGRYRIEIWYQNVCLGSESFNIYD